MYSFSDMDQVISDLFPGYISDAWTSEQHFRVCLPSLLFIFTDLIFIKFAKHKKANEIRRKYFKNHRKYANG